MKRRNINDEEEDYGLDNCLITPLPSACLARGLADAADDDVEDAT